MTHATNVGVIVLAAGASERMGQPKQLLRLGGRSLLRRAVDTALASVCRPVVVTIGAHRDLVEAELTSLPVVVAHNPEWSQGMSSSLRVGVAALLRAAAGVEGAVITLGDQPLVRAADIDRLVDTRHDTRKDIVASAYAGVRGVPMFIAAAMFDDVAALQGQGGAKHLIARYPARVAVVQLEAAAVDLDTPADVDRMVRSTPRDLG